MMRIALIILLGLQFAVSFCQPVGKNLEYFLRVQEELKIREEFSMVKLHQTKYWNGNIKAQKLYVKFKGDTINRKWIIGKTFEYYRNGNIKAHAEFDLVHFTGTDTSVSYFKNGVIKYLLTIENDSVLTPHPEKIFLRKIWTFEPSAYTVYQYRKSGFKRSNYTYRYINGEGSFDGEMLFYNKDGTYSFNDTYVNGKRVKTPFITVTRE